MTITGASPKLNSPQGEISSNLPTYDGADFGWDNDFLLDIDAYAKYGQSGPMMIAGHYFLMAVTWKIS